MRYLPDYGMAGYIVRVGKSIRTKLRADSEFWKAFLAILNALCARDDALALGICSEATRSID